MCVYISAIMFKGAAAEIREKKAANQARPSPFIRGGIPYEKTSPD